MKKASEFIESLTEIGVDQTEALRLAQDKVAKSELEDDLQDFVSLDVEQFDNVLERVAKALTDDDDEGLVTKSQADYAVHDLEDDAFTPDEDGLIELGTAFEGIAKSISAQNAVLKSTYERTERNYDVLGAGILATGQMLQRVAKSQLALERNLTAIQARQEQIAKAMRIPDPPRSISRTAVPVNRPGERPGSEGGSSQESVNKGGAVNGFDVMKAAKQERYELTKSGKVDAQMQSRLTQLSECIAKAESGVPAQKLIDQYQIQVGN